MMMKMMITDMIVNEMYDGDDDGDDDDEVLNHQRGVSMGGLFSKHFPKGRHKIS